MGEARERKTRREGYRKKNRWTEGRMKGWEGRKGREGDRERG